MTSQRKKIGNKRWEISPGILAKKRGQPRSNCNKRFFANLASTRPLEHHNNVPKSTFGKFLKIVVLKRRVSHLHGNEAKFGPGPLRRHNKEA